MLAEWIHDMAAAGLPASGKMNLTNPGKPGLVGEGGAPSVRQLTCVEPIGMCANGIKRRDRAKNE